MALAGSLGLFVNPPPGRPESEGVGGRPEPEEGGRARKAGAIGGRTKGTRPAAGAVGGRPESLAAGQARDTGAEAGGLGQEAAARSRDAEARGWEAEARSGGGGGSEQGGGDNWALCGVRCAGG